MKIWWLFCSFLTKYFSRLWLYFWKHVYMRFNWFSVFGKHIHLLSNNSFFRWIKSSCGFTWLLLKNMHFVIRRCSFLNQKNWMVWVINFKSVCVFIKLFSFLYYFVKVKIIMSSFEYITRVFLIKFWYLCWRMNLGLFVWD